MPRLISPKQEGTLLPPVHPNAGLCVAYQHKIDQLIRQMHGSIKFNLIECYKANTPELAQDASPAVAFVNAMRRLGKEWQAKFDEAAKGLGRWFATHTGQHADNAMKKGLSDAGWSVKFKPTRTMNDVMQATLHEQVNLIKSIASEHLSDVQGLVMRSVQQGRNVGWLTGELEQRYNLTRKRASLIARDQNNKATATYARVRQQELGIDRAVWMHSGAGKEPRPTHVANSGHTYSVSEGWYDPAVNEYIWPGQLINCRCVTRAFIPGYGLDK